MKIKEIAAAIENFAPLSLQESYDNAGLIVGRPDDEVHRALLAVDVTDDVLDEAIEEGCDIVITHHPIVFHPLKRFNSADYVQRAVERAIRHGIALYACHTNLDSAPGGMSWQLARLLGIGELEVLEKGPQPGVGFGVAGNLPEAMEIEAFFSRLREVTGVRAIRHSAIARRMIRRVALCTGAGGSLMEAARAAKADLYVTADLRYNDFMLPADDFTVADIGHFESEYCVIDLLFGILSKNLITFAIRKSLRSRNPIEYWI